VCCTVFPEREFSFGIICALTSSMLLCLVKSNSGYFFCCFSRTLYTRYVLNICLPQVHLPRGLHSHRESAV
jgi:hypothetical protein